jgi:hypothetical protein
VVHTDATGWRVGGEPAQLMVCETQTATGSQIRPRHRHAEVPAVIPAEDAGGMMPDRGRGDDARAFDRVEPQTCLAYILRPLRAVVAQQRDWARECGAQRQAVLQDALALWDQHPAPRG